jgi:arylsulfatase A-like enzyme
VNFVLFNPDEMRAESTSCYGHPAVRTANLDRLAAEGTRFENAFVQHPVCSPARCSLMTGWYPHVRGHRTLWHLLRPDEPNLLAYLKQAGYDVRWWGKNDLLAPASWASSVTEAVSPRAGGRVEPLYKPGEPGYYTFLGKARDPAASGPTHDELCVQGAIDYLRRGLKEPFCLYLALGAPHPIYAAAKPWHDMVDPRVVPELRPADLPNKPDFHHLIRRYRGLDRLEAEIFRRVNAAYLGQILEVDHWLGRLLEALEAGGHADDTLVLFYSDHGDWAGDYGLVEKWPSALDDCTVRVPLVVRMPGGARGHVVRECVELIDLLPTVLELAQIQARHSHFGRSLVGQLGGGRGDAGRAAFAEGGYARLEPHCFEGRDEGDQAGRGPEHMYYPKGKMQQDHPESVCRSAMIRTMEYKLIYRAEGVSELYDLRADPCELDNVVARREYAAVRADLERRLLEWYLQTADVTPWDEGPRGMVRVDASGRGMVSCERLAF